jgi:hypothetical protein
MYRLYTETILPNDYVTFLQGYINDDWNRVFIDIDYSPEYRRPDLWKDLIPNEDNNFFCYDEILVCHIFGSAKNIKLPSISGMIKWFKVKWKYLVQNKRFTVGDLQAIELLIKQGLILVKRKSNDLVRVWIKHRISYSKYDFYGNKNHSKVYDAWVYNLPYWMILDIIENEKRFGRDFNNLISLIFNENIAINTIMNNL